MSSFHNSHNSEVNSPRIKPKLTEEQKFHLIDQFFVKKLKFPTLTNAIIDEAISQDFMPFDDKDKILRDPNKLSIFFLKLDPQSPRTKEALDSLELAESACCIFTFQQFQIPELHPIQNLINYMNYLTEKYKELLRIVSTRNLIKKQEKLQKSKNNLNKSHTRQNTSSFLTDGGALIIPTKLTTIMSKSFNTRSLDFLQISFEEKLEMQAKKSQEYLQTLSRYKQLEEEKLKSLQDYYQQKVPIMAKKVETVKQINKIKQQERKKIFQDRQRRTLEKIHELEIKDREQRVKIQECLNKKQEITQQNKIQFNSQYNQELREQQERNQRRDEERREKKKLANYMENQQIEQIMEKQMEKEYVTEQQLQKLKDEINQKRQLSLQKQEYAQQKVMQTQIEYQQNKLEQYIKYADLSNKMVEEQMQIKSEQLDQVKTKLATQFRTVKKNKEKLNHILEQKIESIKKKENDKDISGRLMSIQSSIDIKIKEQTEKNRMKYQRALNNTRAFAEEREREQQKLIEKMVEKSQKQRHLKNQKEQYSQAILKQHLLQRQSVDKIVFQ
ncbi:unnamed protein product (macronuclear) [Paramecium tetraurelia]|uniref:Uncharacterized protein n=1 Tax=Paramecium tetraurelia TaxID=5888 RepID=A0DLR7_PARTE|nr:uncharacterized protein GSPATT00039616001 [Paramecium tetraurelia]CAK83984.1 unnamed protein product [Paramecium tetraurelia]|eukprot:XP_001451381.1 hypothetical protein (macronuclear) [Paramecium tetraurelia strain d4-2]